MANALTDTTIDPAMIHKWPFSEEYEIMSDSWQPLETGGESMSQPDHAAFSRTQAPWYDFGGTLDRNSVYDAHAPDDRLYQPVPKHVGTVSGRGEDSMTREAELTTVLERPRERATRSPQASPSQARLRVRSHGDIMELYGMINAVPDDVADDWHRKLLQIWRSAKQYAIYVCTDIHGLLRQNQLPAQCYEDLRNNSVWKIYADYWQPDLSQNRAPDFSRVSLSTFETLFGELEATARAIEYFRIRAVLDYWFDPTEDEPNGFIYEQETSDSCNTDDDSVDEYMKMRQYLEKFYRDNNQVFVKSGPIAQRRMRKDIRAWARLARCSCIKLSCGSMLIHKSKYGLPHRRRRKLGPSSTNELMPEWYYGGRYYDQGDTSYNQTPAQEPPDASIWQPRDPYAGYSSADSNDSYASNISANTTSKKRRLPRDEGGYMCTFEGCQKAFDRQCDLSQHQRSHKPKDERPYGCEGCDQRFQFPKDLRRHAGSCREAGTSEDY